MRTCAALFATLTATLVTMPVHAQTSARDSTADSVRTRLAPVTVTARGGRISTLDVPLAVTVLSREKLHRSRGYGLNEALSSVPGVVAQSRYGSSDVRIVIRGFGARGAGDRSNAGTSRGIRVLLDGIPETEPDGRTSFDGIDLGAAERIDVVRSNASSLWGNAAGGLVSVSTVPTFEESSAEVEQSTGSYGLLRSLVRLGSEIGGGRVFGSYVHTTFDGYRASSNSRRGLLNLGYTATVGGRTDVAVFAMGSNNLFFIPGPLTRAEAEATPAAANATYLARRERRYNRLGRLGASVAHRASESYEIGGMVYVNPKYLQRSERGTFRDFTRTHAGGNLTFQQRTAFSPTLRSRFMAGTDLAHQDGAVLFYSLTPEGERGTTVRDNKREGASNFGAFATEELDIGEQWTASLGLRYDNIRYIVRSFITPRLNDQRSFVRATPKVGLVYRASRFHSFYANIGGGVEAPAGNETDPEGTFGSDTLYGINPLLDPIRSTTFEVGTKEILGLGEGFLREMSYDIAAYQTNVTNEIVPYRGGRFYFNAGEARRRGVELGVTARAAYGLSLETALTYARNTYLEYRVDSSFYSANLAGHIADYSGNAIVGVPSVFGSVTLGLSPDALKGIAIRVGVQGFGKYFADDANAIAVPGYAIVNTTLSLDRPIALGGGIGLRGFVAINNAGNRSYLASAFLNPDVVNNVPVAYEPGLPRNVVLSLSLARTR
ncbi:MAG: TonB-dependent receptor [Gemmatimonadaceae bacterium]|nr:TonB-dependent receptor [Gemmatimonadaceae bacterium]